MQQSACKHASDGVNLRFSTGDRDRRALPNIGSGHGQSPRGDAALNQVAVRGKEMAQQFADGAESASLLELMSLDQTCRQNRRIIIDRADSDQAQGRVDAKLEHVRDAALLEQNFAILRRVGQKGKRQYVSSGVGFLSETMDHVERR